MKKRISIHAAREGGDEALKRGMKSMSISIHAAREGGDCPLCDIFPGCIISIHAAREGGDNVCSRRAHTA